MTVEQKTLPRAMSLAVHELRTPVTVVSGYLRMLLKEQAGPLSEKQRKMLEEAERSCGRIGAIVQEMSDLGKLEAGELALARQPFDLAALLAELAGDMHEGENRGVRLELRGIDRPLEVVGDRLRIAAALGALLHAALRERGEPGVIVAECRQVGDEARIVIGDDATVEQLSRSAAEAPFEEWRGGLGLALPVARRVVEALGGALASVPGDRPRSGSTLRIPLRAT